MEEATSTPTIKFDCPTCDQPLQIEAEAAGELITCPSCGTTVKVPQKSPSSAPHRQVKLKKNQVTTGRPQRRRRSSSSSKFPLIMTLMVLGLLGGGWWWISSSDPEALASLRQNLLPGAQPRTAEVPEQAGSAPQPPVQPTASVEKPGEPAATEPISADSSEAVSLAEEPATILPTQTPPPEVAEQPPPSPVVAPQATPVPTPTPFPVYSGPWPHQLSLHRWNVSTEAMVETFQFGFPGETKTTIVDITVRPDGRLILVGTLPGTEVPKGVRRAHALGEPVPGATHAFVAQLSADGQTVQWISRLGGEIITPTCVGLGPYGSIFVGGKAGNRASSAAGPDGGDFYGSSAAVLKIRPDGSALEWIRAGGPNQQKVVDLVVDREGRVIFAGGTKGRGQAAYILRKNPDGSDSSFPGQPNGREWAIDFDVRGGQFTDSGQIGAFYAQGTGGNSYDYDGPGKWGDVRFKLFGMRQGGHLALMPNGDIVASGTLQYDFKEGGNKWFPAFDTIVARWDETGRLLWSTNLYQEGDSVHTPDQKDSGLLVHPGNGDLYVSVGQHGSNVYRFKGNLYGDTGNLFIYWIGRIDSQSGELKQGWYWQNSRNTRYTKAGFPESPPYPKLAGNKISGMAVGPQGHIYFAGRSGPKAFSTRKAWKDWPKDETGGGNAALVVLDQDLDKILYATQIMGAEHSKSNAHAIAITPQGIWIGGTNGGSGFATSPAPWSNRDVQGVQDAALTKFRFR